MRKLTALALVLSVLLFQFTPLASVKAETVEPVVSVKLVNYLGDQHAITIKPSYLYTIKNSDLVLNANTEYTVTATTQGVILKQGATVLGEFTSFEITPSLYKNPVSINGRQYLGDVAFTNEKGTYVRPVNTLPIEDYLKGVVPNEVYTSWNLQALKTQAVAARTYAMSYAGKVINDTVSYQVYGGYTWYDSTNQAVDQTFGQVVTYNNKLINAVFSSSNGGRTESNSNAWGGTQLSYFPVKEDPYDKQTPWTLAIQKTQIDLTGKDLANYSTWWNTVSEKDKTVTDNLKSWLVANKHPGKTIKITSIPKVSFYAPSSGGRVTKGAITVDYLVKGDVDSSQKLVVHHLELKDLTSTKLKSMLNSRAMLSLLVTETNETSTSTTFNGKGNGHGVGMSQYGAQKMASLGKDYREILDFYYPTTTLLSFYTTKYPRKEQEQEPPKDTVAPDAPSVNALGDNETSLTGVTEPNASVIAKVENEVIGTGLADEAGKFVITIAKQSADTKVSVTSKDAAENESTATVVTVTDQTPPSVPIVNEVSDQDTTVTGVTEANAAVTVKAGDATFSAVADGNGTFTVSIPVQIGGTTIAVSAKDKAGNESQAPSFAVKSTLKAPLAPKVNEVSDQDTMIKGTAEANATVIVKNGSLQLAAGNADAKGNYSISIAKQKAGSTLSVTAQNAGGTSSATAVTVQDKTAPAAPKVNAVSDQDTKVTGTAEANAAVIIKNGSLQLAAGKADSKGTYSISIAKQKAGSKLSVTAGNAAGVSPVVTVTVQDKTAPVTPKVNAVSNQDTVVTGSTETGAEVHVKIDKKVIGKGNAKSDGTFSITIPKQPASTKLAVIAKDAANNYSSNTFVTVSAALKKPALPTVATLTEKSTAVTGTGEKNASIYIKVGGKIIASGKIDGNGKFSVKIPAQKAGTEVTAVLQNKVGYSPYKIVKVQDTTPPAPPAVNAVTSLSTFISGKTEANALITIKSGTKVIASGKADSKGQFKVTIPKQTAGVKLAVTAKDAANNYSSNTFVTVSAALKKPALPTVATLTEKSTAVTGTGEKNASIYIKVGGKIIASGKIDGNGKFSVKIPAQKAGTEVTAVLQNKVGYSPYKIVKVQDTTPPAPPAVNAVTSLSTFISGKTEANAVITIKSGTKVIGSGKADSKGQFKVTIPKQKAGVKLAVTAKDAAGNTSSAVNINVK
ncbi:Ig-like domain-containing protein [Priestia aryabhattai]|uniref:Ig-like domain-containing protein n=1 Tax=Priestia aryabhattai TaxID=412384 RepID=UPI002452C1F0|nr:Ig-like domain-containing protein [Priestia aryabhattai]MDH3115928.1 Ig-like domain-containing protein [Priestia aryabhattai]MDH3125181.1 Ig-like domain-containing protein [Priestia aryabhattai]